MYDCYLSCSQFADRNHKMHYTEPWLFPVSVVRFSMNEERLKGWHVMFSLVGQAEHTYIVYI